MNKKKITIEAWSDFRCPFCYIASAMLRNLSNSIDDQAQLEIIHRSYELYPEAPKYTESTILDSYSAKYDISKAEAEEKIAAITEYGRKVGINNFNYGGAVPTNSFNAHRLCKYGCETGHPEIFDNLMYAYFCDNVNIADTDILLEIAQASGLDRGAALDMLNSHRYEREVDDDERQAYNLGIRSVPCFYYEGQQFIGTGCIAALKERILKSIEIG